MNQYDLAEWIFRNQGVFYGRVEFQFDTEQWYVYKANGERREKRAFTPEVGIALMRAIRDEAAKEGNEIPGDVAEKAEGLGTATNAYRVVNALKNVILDHAKARRKVWPWDVI